MTGLVHGGQYCACTVLATLGCQQPSQHLLPVVDTKEGFPLPMDVFGASWEDKIICSCFFPFSFCFSTDELWNATRYKERKDNLMYGESLFWNDLRTTS